MTWSTKLLQILPLRKCFRSKCVIVVAFLYIVTLLVSTDGQIPVRVIRRLHRDSYFLQSGTHINCEENFIYLVDERRCTNDSDLINSKVLSD